MLAIETLMLSFNSIDVETANEDRSSICQIGIVRIEDGAIQDQWKALVNPEAEFDPWNTYIHGITEDDVRGSPTLPQLHDELRDRLNAAVIVSHTAFDRVAVARGLAKYDLDPLAATWLDSARVARRAWPDEFGKRGWGLKTIAKAFDISFRHHDALADARVAALIVLRACESSGLEIDGWLERVNHPIFDQSKTKNAVRKPITREGREDGSLFGETVVFTGKLGLPRNQVADRAAAAGCSVRRGVTKKTTMLVVGLQNKRMLGGHEKSRKQRRAEELIRQGTDIQILSEEDFFELASIEVPPVSAPAEQPESPAPRKRQMVEFTIELPSELERAGRRFREEDADRRGE